MKSSALDASERQVLGLSLHRDANVRSSIDLAVTTRRTCRVCWATVVAATGSAMNGPAHFASLVFIAPLSRDRAQRLANRLAVNEPAVLADIGCGWGELLMQVVALTTSGIGVGVDIDEVALDRGRALAIAKGPAGRVRFVARLEDAAVTAADVVICCGASHVFGTTAQALAAQYALTEPGGRALFAEAFWDKAAAQGSEAPDGMDDLSELGDHRRPSRRRWISSVVDRNRVS